MDRSRQITFQKTDFLLAAAVILALAAWGAYAYLFHETHAAGREDAALAGQSLALQAEQSQASGLAGKLAADSADEPELASYFVDATDPAPLFAALEGYGAEVGVTVAVSSADVKREPDRLVVTLKSDGSFASTYRFLSLVEAAPYDFSLTNAKVALVPDATAKAGKPVAKAAPEWEATMTVSITTVANAASVPLPK